MGALHAGHGRLIGTARAECGAVAVSVFVNPIQFDRQDDYERYPRTLASDAAFAEARGADLVFAPEIAEMYPQRHRAFVDVELLTEHLCGQFRPGHFRGVATVVAKLLNIVQPDRAYFGQKDAQQLAVIRRMVADLNLPVCDRRRADRARGGRPGAQLAQPAPGGGRARSGAACCTRLCWRRRR